MQDKKPSGKAPLWASVFLNGLLVGVKLTLGILGRSQALIADAVHSITDFITDIMAFAGLKYAGKGEDHDHPFGHAKIETIMTMLIGIAMILAGLALGYEAVLTAVNKTYTRPSWIALVGALLSIAVKEYLYQYTYRVGKKLRSQVLVANAWHHRSDAFSSIAVSLGIIAALVDPGWALLDPFAALLVSLLIIKVGIDITIPAFKSISDISPDANKIAEIEAVAASVDGVRNAHDIRARYYGNLLYVEVHIVVDPGITVSAGHDIAVEVRKKVKAEVDDVLDVIIHVDPDKKH